VPIGRHAGAGGQSARVGLARELPPQRVVGRPPALLCGGGGPCRGHTAAPMALRRRCARRRAAECACRTAGSVGFELGWMLGAFRRRPRPSLLSILSSLDSARCAVCRRFSRFPMDVPARAARHLFEAHDPAGSGGCVPLSVRCTRTPARHYPPFYWLLVIAHRQLSDRIFSCGA
jgi:hypothetical protein